MKNLTPKQRALLGSARYARLADAHAEITVLFAAMMENVRPEILVSSRAMCDACRKFIEDWGGKLISDTVAIW